MEIPRARIIEIIVSVAAVFAMLIGMIIIGHMYTQNGEFGQDGGLMLVAAIVVFVLVMTAIGYFLAFKITPKEAAADASD